MKSLKISETAPALPLLKPYEYDENQQEIEAENLLVKELEKYATTQKRLENIQKLPYSQHNKEQRCFFFTNEQASKIAQVITAINKVYTGTDPIYISRKNSNLDWKLIFDCGAKTTEKIVLMIHKKELFYTEKGYSKIGRIALKLFFNGDHWTSSLCYNLSSKKGRDMFYCALKHEDEIYKSKPLSTILPTRLFNYMNSTEKHPNKRSCFYELHRSLYDLICDGRILYDRSWSKQIVVGIANAILSVHKEGYICGDIKEENILLGKNDRVILCDTDTFTKINIVGIRCTTHEYLAPESTLKNFDKQKAEVFSFGCILHYFSTRTEPIWSQEQRSFSKDADELVYTKKAQFAKSLLENKDITEITTKDLLQNLAFWCLSPSPEKRPDMHTVCAQLKRHSSDDDSDDDTNDLVGDEIDTPVNDQTCLIN